MKGPTETFSPQYAMYIVQWEKDGRLFRHLNEQPWAELGEARQDFFRKEAEFYFKLYLPKEQRGDTCHGEFV